MVMEARQWGTTHVQKFIEGLGPHVASYSAVFDKHSIDGAQLLDLCYSDLLSMGMTNEAHNKLLLNSIQILRYCNI